MSKNSAKSNYSNLMEWLRVRGIQVKPKITIYNPK